MDRITVTLDEQLGRHVRIAAAEAGVSVSAWLSQAASDLLRNHLLGEALDALDAEFGPSTPEEVAWARRVLRGEEPEDSQPRPRSSTDAQHEVQ